MHRWSLCICCKTHETQITKKVLLHNRKLMKETHEWTIERSKWTFNEASLLFQQYVGFIKSHFVVNNKGCAPAVIQPGWHIKWHISNLVKLLSRLLTCVQSWNMCWHDSVYIHEKNKDICSLTTAVPYPMAWQKCISGLSGTTFLLHMYQCFFLFPLGFNVFSFLVLLKAYS